MKNKNPFPLIVILFVIIVLITVTNIIYKEEHSKLSYAVEEKVLEDGEILYKGNSLKVYEVCYRGVKYIMMEGGFMVPLMIRTSNGQPRVEMCNNEGVF